MTSTSLGALIGLAAALSVASQLGGAAGRGVVLGALAALGTTFVFARLQRRSLGRSPASLLAWMTAGFVAKLALLVGGILVLRFVDAASRFDWRAYAVAFAASILLAGAPATIGAIRDARLAKGGRAP